MTENPPTLGPLPEKKALFSHLLIPRFIIIRVEWIIDWLKRQSLVIRLRGVRRIWIGWRIIVRIFRRWRIMVGMRSRRMSYFFGGLGNFEKTFFEPKKFKKIKKYTYTNLMRCKPNQLQISLFN